MSYKYIKRLIKYTKKKTIKLEEKKIGKKRKKRWDLVSETNSYCKKSSLRKKEEAPIKE